MKKTQTIAMAFSALALMSAAKEAKLTKQAEQESKKVFTQHFFNPTRSMRVKNKLRRKWYK